MQKGRERTKASMKSALEYKINIYGWSLILLAYNQPNIITFHQTMTEGKQLVFSDCIMYHSFKTTATRKSLCANGALVRFGYTMDLPHIRVQQHIVSRRPHIHDVSPCCVQNGHDAWGSCCERTGDGIVCNSVSWLWLCFYDSSLPAEPLVMFGVMHPSYHSQPLGNSLGPFCKSSATFSDGSGVEAMDTIPISTLTLL